MSLSPQRRSIINQRTTTTTRYVRQPHFVSGRRHRRPSSLSSLKEQDDEILEEVSIDDHESYISNDIEREEEFHWRLRTKRVVNVHGIEMTTTTTTTTATTATTTESSLVNTNTSHKLETTTSVDMHSHMNDDEDDHDIDEHQGLINGTNGITTNGDSHHRDDTEGNSAHSSQTTSRTGTISSARFNLLSTMVGGGSLSLPLAFQKTGNILLAPLLLILIAALSEFCFRVLANSTRVLSPMRDTSVPGKDSFESIAQAAFGRRAHMFSMALVVVMCFFATVAYSVLLRDLASTFLPQDWVLQVTGNSPSTGPNLPNNMAMLTVVLLVTPFCTLRTLTALERFGAASMLSIAILLFCITFRSVQCNATDKFSHVRKESWWDYVSFGPQTPKDVLDAFPLFVSCFVCHYTVPLVQNELVNPTPQRVAWWLKSTTWSAAIFYLLMGIAGSSFGNCAADKELHGNILLDFAKDDPLLLVGRICLAITVTLAFPMLVIPARDILIRAMVNPRYDVRDETVLPTTTNGSTANATTMQNGQVDEDDAVRRSLEEPLLDSVTPAPGSHAEPPVPTASFPSLWHRLVAAIIIFWAAAALACVVQSIDIVWELLGSSFSILMSYLIPSSCYLLITRKYATTSDADGGSHLRDKLTKLVAWTLILLFTPLMFLSTGNAISNIIQKR